MDAILGRIRARAPQGATLIVMSDHGFAPYYKKVHLNTWLHREGYLALVRPEEPGGPLFDNVFWRRTRAYAAGINGLYVNLAGREARGIVAHGPEYDRLVDEISTRLLALRDPENGAQVVATVDRARDVYHGAEVPNAPDLIVGYNRGYRSSDDSALGSVGSELVTPNLGKWTGDHCMAHELVPGILVSNRRSRVEDPRLIDLPVTILAAFGVDPPAAMTGRVVIEAR
jgi:predicted AlkP superfamily phosphohydrolase/phosphomutase